MIDHYTVMVPVEHIVNTLRVAYRNGLEGIDMADLLILLLDRAVSIRTGIESNGDEDCDEDCDE